MTNIVCSNNNDFSRWATDFSKKYPDVLQHWKEHGDPLRKGLALLVLGNEAVPSNKDEQKDWRVQV